MGQDFSLNEFLAWVRTKPADEEYDFFDVAHCAVAQFGEATGRQLLIGVPYLENVIGPECHDAVMGDVVGHDWSFGALAKRLEALCPETPNYAKIDAYLADLEAVEA